jgi:VIT1/CCC1 family predicted Fe2+/Mn2+ transporter
MDSKEASSDCGAITASLRMSLQILWNSAVTEGFGVFSDFVSFTRLSFADAAEFVAEKSNKAVEKLRGVEAEVQSGERDSVGIKKQTKEELERADARDMFEKSMDTVKDTGSVAIGIAQSAGHKTTDLADRSRTRLHAAISTVSLRLALRNTPH